MAAMSAVTANLQHRKWTQQRLKELETEVEKTLGDCVLLVQELSSAADGAAAAGLGEGVHVNKAGTACVVLPRSVRQHVIESELSADAWCAVRTREAAWVSLHLPCVKNKSTVDRAEAILAEISAKLRGWKRRGRPPEWIVVGGDFNVQLPRSVPGVTGNRVWEEKPKSALHTRQAEAVIAFCKEFKIEAINTWRGAGSLGEPEEGGEGGEEEDASLKREAWARCLDPDCWTWAKGEVKDQIEEKKEK